MYTTPKTEKTFLSLIMKDYNLRVDKEKFGDLSITEIWTGVTMKRSIRDKYNSFVDAAVTEDFLKRKQAAEAEGQPYNYELAKVTRSLTAEKFMP